MSNELTARETILARLAGGESLRAICRDDGMPAPSTVLDWARSEPFGEQYARARELGYQLLADEILEISDDGKGDSYEDEDGNTRTNQDVIARSRLRVDSRKWLLSKMLPKVYGDKLELGGTLGVKRAPTDLSDAELEAVIRAKAIGHEPDA